MCCAWGEGGNGDLGSGYPAWSQPETRTIHPVFLSTLEKDGDGFSGSHWIIQSLIRLWGWNGIGSQSWERGWSIYHTKLYSMVPYRRVMTVTLCTVLQGNHHPGGFHPCPSQKMAENEESAIIGKNWVCGEPRSHVPRAERYV